MRVRSKYVYLGRRDQEFEAFVGSDGREVPGGVRTELVLFDPHAVEAVVVRVRSHQVDGLPPLTFGQEVTADLDVGPRYILLLRLVTDPSLRAVAGA